MKTRHPLRFRISRALLLLALLLFTCFVQSSFAPAAVSHAAAKTQRVSFTDGSGSYLERSGSVWRLYSRSKKPLSGVRQLCIPRVKNLSSGCYMFDKKGKLIQKKAVYQFRNKNVNGIVFDGFHYTNKNGRFATNGGSVTYLNGQKCAGKKFKGYYYLGAYGKMSAPAQVRLLNKVRSGRVTFSGFYYFNKYGQLCTKADFHKLKQSAGGRTFDGIYYFGGKNGRLTTKKGWVTYKKQRYCIDSDGRRMANCWQSGYYLQSNGTIARSKKLADGTYVDYDGRKCDGATAAIDPLRSQLQKMVRGYRGSWSVYVKDLDTGAAINLNERAMYPASTIKAFVMAATFDRIQRGKLSYSSGVRSLMNNMITISDNESYNALVRRNSGSGSFTSGAAEVNRYLKRCGYKKTGCHSTLHPSSSAHASDGHRNTASAKDCGLLLERIYRKTCVSRKYSEEMLRLLCRQQRRWKIPSGIPSGVRIANKTGETSSTQHDMAIVYGPKTDYILCVFSSGVSESGGASCIRSISRKVYNYLN